MIRLLVTFPPGQPHSLPRQADLLPPPAPSSFTDSPKHPGLTLWSLPAQAALQQAPQLQWAITTLYLISLLYFTNVFWRKLRYLPQPWIPRQPSAWSTVSTQTVSLRLLDEQILNWWKKIYWFAVLRHSGSHLNYCSLKTKDSNSLKYVLEKQKEISSFQRMSFGWGLGFFALPFLQHWTYIYLTLVILLDSSLGDGIAKGKIIYKGARKMYVWILVQALFTENLG